MSMERFVLNTYIYQAPSLTGAVPFSFICHEGFKGVTTTNVAVALTLYDGAAPSKSESEGSLGFVTIQVKIGWVINRYCIIIIIIQTLYIGSLCLYIYIFIIKIGSSVWYYYDVLI